MAGTTRHLDFCSLFPASEPMPPHSPLGQQQSYLLGVFGPPEAVAGGADPT
jgi:hypothetical protein